MKTVHGLEIGFRTDASLQIGTGHVMRCLALADALMAEGAKCHFISREHPGHLFDLIRQRGHEVIELPSPTTIDSNVLEDTNGQLAHAEWLGTHWRTDAIQTQTALSKFSAAWIIVDHYAIDARWESALKPYYRKLMVIDDLADREHICDVLLDQNLVEGMSTRHQDKVPSDCISLIGPSFALLRPEFVALRPASLARRKIPALNRLLVFMGGSDPDNETGKAITGLKLSNKAWQHIDVVVGQGHPAIRQLKESLASFSSASLHVQTPDMGKLMEAADLAVTAGGSVTWEKCALGLPSLVVVLGENQNPIAAMMHERGALQQLGVGVDLTPACYAKYLDEIQACELSVMTACASAVCDGSGLHQVLKIIRNES